jgi:hypothetical protein
MRLLLVPLTFLLGACATQVQVTGPCAGQLSKSDIQQIVALMPADRETMSHTYTKLDVLGPDRVHVTVGGFARNLQGIATSGPANYSFIRLSETGNGIRQGSSKWRQQLAVIEAT